MGGELKIGERANLHPSGDERYVVEVIDQDDGMVRISYVSGTAPAWWITAAAWTDSRRLGPA